jgi:V/A-type H+-transporting ATPase subunit G/H
MKEVVQSTVADSKVSRIIKSLSELENDIDSLNIKIAEMKKSLNSKSLKEIDSLKAKVTQMAIKEAESMIVETKARAEQQAKKIASDGAAKIEKLKTTIDTKFDLAVDSVVSTILKP